MGYASAANPRSRQGRDPATGRKKTPAYVSLHRLWRAVDYFQGDAVQFEAWMESKQLPDRERAALRFLWDKRYPKPLVTIAHG